MFDTFVGLCFVVFYDKNVLIVLNGFSGMSPLPTAERLLDWYSRNYSIERKRLSGTYVQSIEVDRGMRYEDFY